MPREVDQGRTLLETLANVSGSEHGVGDGFRTRWTRFFQVGDGAWLLVL